MVREAGVKETWRSASAARPEGRMESVLCGETGPPQAIKTARISLTLVSVGPVTTRSASAENKV